MALNTTPAFSGASATSPASVADAALLSGLADSTSFVRDFWPTLLDRYPDRQLIENGLMAHLVDNKAFVGVQTNTTQVFHAEQDSVLNTLTVVSVSGGATAGAVATITVNSVVYNGNNYNYATVGQNFQVADNPSAILNVVAVGASGGATFTIDVRPSSDVTANTVVQAGDTLLPQDAVNDVNGNFPDGTVS